MEQNNYWFANQFKLCPLFIAVFTVQVKEEVRFPKKPDFLLAISNNLL